MGYIRMSTQYLENWITCIPGSEMYFDCKLSLQEVYIKVLVSFGYNWAVIVSLR